MPDPTVAVFLGAGASCAEGAPTQQGLFKVYFQCCREEPFSDADRHVKYLLKRVQVNSLKLRRVVVFKWHLGRKEREAVGQPA